MLLRILYTSVNTLSLIIDYTYVNYCCHMINKFTFDNLYTHLVLANIETMGSVLTQGTEKTISVIYFDSIHLDVSIECITFLTWATDCQHLIYSSRNIFNSFI